MIRDIIHQEILVGDTVAFNPPKYKGLVVGKVVSLSKNGATMEYTLRGRDLKANRHCSDIVVISKQLEHSKDINAEYFI